MSENTKIKIEDKVLIKLAKEVEVKGTALNIAAGNLTKESIDGYLKLTKIRLEASKKFREKAYSVYAELLPDLDYKLRIDKTGCWIIKP